MTSEPARPIEIPKGSMPAEIDESTHQALLEYVEPIQVRAGTILLQQGQPNDRLWFLLEGTATIERDWRGKALAIAKLSAPGVFGATTFFRPTQATVTIRATSDCSLLTLSSQAHQRLRAENPVAAEALALATVRVLSERFDLLDQRMTDFMNMTEQDHVRDNEWARFRARLFEKPNII